MLAATMRYLEWHSALSESTLCSGGLLWVKKTLRRWIPVESPTSPARQSLLRASSEEASESGEAKSRGSSAIFILLSQLRILIALWGVLVQGMMVATFDAVRYLGLAHMAKTHPV